MATAKRKNEPIVIQRGFQPEAEKGYSDEAEVATAAFLGQGPEASWPDPAPLPPPVKAELTRLGARAAALDRAIKDSSAELEGIKKRFRALMAAHGDAIAIEERSRYWRMPRLGLQVRVTYPSLTPYMDYDELQAAVGNEVFGAITRPTGWELVPKEVNIAIQAERLTEGQMAKCIHDPPSREPSVYIEKLGKGAAR